MIELIMAAIWFVIFVGIGFTVRVLMEWDARAFIILLTFFIIAAALRIAIVGLEPIAGGMNARPWLIPIAAIGFFSGDYLGGKFYEEEIMSDSFETEEEEATTEGGSA